MSTYNLVLSVFLRFSRSSVAVLGERRRRRDGMVIMVVYFY